MVTTLRVRFFHPAMTPASTGVPGRDVQSLVVLTGLSRVAERKAVLAQEKMVMVMTPAVENPDPRGLDSDHRPVGLATSHHDMTRTADQILAQARARVGPALRAAVQGLPVSMARVASYHFGWCDTDGTVRTAAETGWGKGIRSALALSCTQAANGTVADGLPAAVAVELIHNASLVHDDIIDHDTHRRHRPTVWAAFDIPTALLAGDALFFLAVEVLAQNPPAASPVATNQAILKLTNTVQQLIDGQHADCTFEKTREVSLTQCLAMTAGKTAALIECTCALGAAYGGATATQASALSQFGTHLGMAFQLIDDLLGIWGDPHCTGKPAGSDLRNRKKTLPVTAALAHNTPHATQLANLLASDRPLTDASLTHALTLLDHTQTRTWTHNQATHELRQALHHLHTAHPHPHAATDLTTLTHFITDRDH
jgi:geranylgeranyl diphosphate synthase type I